MTLGTTNTHMPNAAATRPPQRKMRRLDGTTDPDARVRSTLSAAFEGCFAEDIADLAWKLVCKELLSRCRDENELANHFADALVYWQQPRMWPMMACVWPDQIRNKTHYLMVDAKRKEASVRERSKPVDVDVADLDVASHGDSLGILEANEAYSLVVDVFRRRYADSVDGIVALACIPEFHGETVAARAGDKLLDEFDMQHEVMEVCGDEHAALRFAAEMTAELAAVLYVERPAYRDLEHVQVILRWFVAARRRLNRSGAMPMYRAFWLIEWGWTYYEAHRIAGLTYERTDRKAVERYRKASQRFAECIKQDAERIVLSVDELEPHVPARRG